MLRIPFVIAGLAFAKLSRSLMLVYFVASLIAAYRILIEVRRMAGDASGKPRPPSAFAVCVLVGSVGWGSTIFFLGSRGFIFHEAILAGITFALWSIWCSLGFWSAPASRWWIGALLCGIASVHARAPTGLYALSLLATIALALGIREMPERNGLRQIRRAFTIAACCGVGFLSLNGLAWLKFRTFDAAPLKLSRPYTDPGRLEHIEGKSFHLVNLPFNFDTYLLRPNFRLEPRFPWIYLGSNAPRRDFPQAKIDLPDFTLGLPYAMTSLFALATLGCVAAACWQPGMRIPIAAIWLAVLPMTLALFAAIATAQRYTGDFCPFLIGAAAFGLIAMEDVVPRWRFAGRAMIVGATLCAMSVTWALTLHYQGETLWGVPEETRQAYQLLRQRVDHCLGRPAGDPNAPLPPPRTHVDR